MSLWISFEAKVSVQGFESTKNLEIRKCSESWQLVLGQFSVDTLAGCRFFKVDANSHNRGCWIHWLNLALEAQSRGFEVSGVDVFTSYYNPDLKRFNEKRLIEARIEIANADLAEASLEELVGGVDGIIHLAGQPGISNCALGGLQSQQRSRDTSANRSG